MKNHKNENKDGKSCENTSSFSCNLAWCVKYIAFFYCRQKYTIIFYLSAGYQFQGKKNWTTKNGLQSSPKLTMWSSYFWWKNCNKYSNKTSKTFEPKKQIFRVSELVVGFSEQNNYWLIQDEKSFKNDNLKKNIYRWKWELWSCHHSKHYQLWFGTRRITRWNLRPVCSSNQQKSKSGTYWQDLATFVSGRRGFSPGKIVFQIFCQLSKRPSVYCRPN